MIFRVFGLRSMIEEVPVEYLGGRSTCEHEEREKGWSCTILMVQRMHVAKTVMLTIGKISLIPGVGPKELIT